MVSPAVARFGRFIYVVDGEEYGRIYGFAIDGASGALAALSGSPFAADHGPWSVTTAVTP
jgi:hypothetical protein